MKTEGLATEKEYLPKALDKGHEQQQGEEGEEELVEEVRDVMLAENNHTDNGSKADEGHRQRRENPAAARGEDKQTRCEFDMRQVVLPGNLLDAVAVLLPSGHQFVQRITTLLTTLRI